MYTSNLEESIQQELIDADEIWIATGLISKGGLSYIEHLTAQVHILVGIDLPTPPMVLRKLMDWADLGKVKFKVFSNEDTFFHPKLYIWRKGNSRKAYVGSGNMTNGGWDSNVELFWQVEKDTECQKLINWFGIHMEMGIAIDKQYIDDYETRVFKPSEDANHAQRNRLDSFKSKYENDYEFYFRKEDFDAFTYDRAIIDNPVAKEARKKVNRKMHLLHDRIFPKLYAKGFDLHPHHRHQNIVSSFAHTARNSKILDGMWLYYGKSPKEAAWHPARNDSEKSMNNHVRLQLIIRQNTIGVWCAVGKGWGSRVDRNYFHEKMQVKNNQEHFFSLIKRLGDEYFIALAGKNPPYYVRDIKHQDQLYAISMEDWGNLEHYFIIGMDVLPNDERLLDHKIEDFVITEFEKLYPVYNFFRAPVD